MQEIFSGPRARIAETALALSIVVTGCANPATQAPSRTSPSNEPAIPTLISPKPSTSTSSIAPSSSPSPSPVEVSPTPEPTPNIETVPLVGYGGDISMDAQAKYMKIYDATVTRVDENPDGTIKDFIVTIKGDKFKKITSKQEPWNSSATGISFKMTLSKDISVYNANTEGHIGEGVTAVSPFIKLGDTISTIVVSWNTSSVAGYKAQTHKLNIPTITKFNNIRNGTHIPRLEGENLNVYPTGFAVQP